MISFKTMWEDVNAILTMNSLEFKILEVFKEGFVIKEGEETTFITKEDFVDFWCNMLYFNEVSKAKLVNESKNKLKYVYEVVKKLPYIVENCEVLMIEE